jgi:hypothetical protein
MFLKLLIERFYCFTSNVKGFGQVGNFVQIQQISILVAEGLYFFVKLFQFRVVVQFNF